MNVQMYKMYVIIVRNTIKVQINYSFFTSTLIHCKYLVIGIWIIFVEKTVSMA